MPIIHKTLYLSSEHADQRSADGSQFLISFDRALTIPAHAQNCTVKLYNFQGWLTYPNILVGRNDVFSFTDGVPNLYNIVIPQGRYSLSDLEKYVNDHLADTVSFPSNSGLSFAFEGVHTNGRIIVKVKKAGWLIHADSNSFINTLFGFDTDIGFSATIFYAQTSEREATFNSLDHLLLNLPALVAGDVSRNGTQSSSVSPILIGQVSPGSQFSYQPLVLLPVSCKTGVSISQLSVSLTDQNGVAVDTAGDFYSARIGIEYTI